ncbi:helitron_like_N domain-containing protein [Trichonephila clavipes]|nr:helitron_like_N domain-containing protein [Trichonephila clavipes]
MISLHPNVVIGKMDKICMYCSALKFKKMKSVECAAPVEKLSYQNYIHHPKCRQLFHQYIVDMYAKIETERLLYIRLNQTELRSEQYIHLRDAIVNDGNVNPNELGRMAILPSTFTGSSRHMCMNTHKMR